MLKRKTAHKRKQSNKRKRKQSHKRKTARKRKQSHKRKHIVGGGDEEVGIEVPDVIIDKPRNYAKIDNALKAELASKLRNPTENLGKMLSVVCKDPDNCLALGDYGIMVKQFFENFQNLSLVDINQMKRLGAPSSNGFVFEIPFKKNLYTSYTVLKSATKPSADNLFYEYYVGKTFINNYVSKFPLFLETYDCYRYNSIPMANSFKRVANKEIKMRDVGIVMLSDALTRIEHGDLEDPSELRNQFESSCTDSDTFCVLIQHFNNLKPFKDLFDNPVRDFAFLFYQLYFVLSVLGNKYTHYDLHYENACVYKPYEGNKYILMRYHSNGTVYEFPSEYIVKLIDYGRNYINNGTTTTNKIVKDIICKSAQCKPNCGEQQGYNIIQGDVSFYNIVPTEPNMSHDLRLFSQFTDQYGKSNIYEKDFYYGDTYGTPQDLTGNYLNIRSVHDLRSALEKTAIPNYKKGIIQKYATWTKAAEMDVYDDGRDYEFKTM